MKIQSFQRLICHWCCVFFHLPRTSLWWSEMLRAVSFLISVKSEDHRSYLSDSARSCHVQHTPFIWNLRNPSLISASSINDKRMKSHFKVVKNWEHCPFLMATGRVPWPHSKWKFPSFSASWDLFSTWEILQDRLSLCDLKFSRTNCVCTYDCQLACFFTLSLHVIWYGVLHVDTSSASALRLCVFRRLWERWWIWC